MYEKFFGFNDLPFSIAPNPRYLYMSKHHHEALAHLLYGVKQDGGFILLTGEVGTGKTTVCRCFLERIPENCHVAVILNPKLSIDELLETLCDELGIPYLQDNISVKGYLDVLNHFLLKAHSQNQKVILIIDEAQNLSIDVLEQIRLLTNLETDQRKLLQIVLIGQPELRTLFEKKELRQLAQRITARYHLEHLSLPETDAYIRHRLEVSGCGFELFPKSVVRIIFKLTNGIPRLINVLCDRALLGAYVSGQRYVDKNILRQSAREVMAHKRVFSTEFWKSHQWRLKIKVTMAVMFFLVALVAIVVQFVKYKIDPVSQQASSVLSVPTIAPSLVSATPSKNHLDAKTAQKSLNLDGASLASDEKKLPGQKVELDLVAELERQLTQIEKDSQVVEPVASLQKLWRADWSTTADFASALHFLYVYQGEQPGLSDLSLEGCTRSNKNGFTCYQKEGANLEDLKRLPLPVMLKLIKPGTTVPFYVIVMGLTNAEVALQMNPAAVNLGQRKRLTISLTELSSYWRGQYTLIWQIPPGYYGPIELGTIGPGVKWLSQRLGQIYNDPSLMNGVSIYNETLLTSVKKFQEQVGLAPDGVVGPSTLLQLQRVYNEKKKNESPLSQPRVKQLGGG